METQAKQIYHCDRCGETFKSRVKPISEMRCTGCGLHPVKSKFANLTEMPALETSVLDMNHSVAGKDMADFVSMRMAQKRRRAVMMYVCWMLLLASVAGVGWYVKNKNDARAEEREALNKEEQRHQRKTDAALIYCERVFAIFSRTSSSSQKVEQLVGGVENIVAMRQFYSNNLNRSDYRNAKLEKTYLSVVDGMKRLDALYRIKNKRGGDHLFEVVFWEVKEDKWLMDWQQFVRINEVDWSKFVLDKVLDEQFKFNLYVRKRKVDSSGDSPYAELLFSKAFNDNRQPDELESVVLVKKDSALFKSILFHIVATEKEQLADDEVLKKMDLPGKARVHAVIAYEEIDGKQVMVLKELLDTDWQLPPAEWKKEKEKKK